MTDDTEVEHLLGRLIGGDAAASAEVVARARTGTSPRLLVAAAVLAGASENPLLTRAADNAATPRDRQLVAVAAAHLTADEELLDALVREHLADHPDNVLAAWIAAKHRHHGLQPNEGEVMSALTSTSAPQVSAGPSTVRLVGRWLLTFLGFPGGGLAAKLIVGRVDTVTAAIVGGVIAGVIVGVVQVWGMGANRPSPWQWIVATAAGFGAGLGSGAAAVDYKTSLGALALQGAICGVAVGAAQAIVLRRRLGRLAIAWVPALAALWALGWTVTTAGGIQVDEQFTVFGSFGAITVTLLTAVLPLTLNRRAS